MPITTHILDTSRGTPAASVSIVLDFLKSPGNWEAIATAQTNQDGRAPNLLPKHHVLEAGRYRLTFQTGAYFAALQAETFYPQIEIQFQIKDPSQHYHVPLLLSPFGFSTYRGS
ncbi:MAG TPA: hydroxyisourate hydrolase [Phycisphaerae bacterium]|nr:hydroxyisourate hydrolase [Phycisphaerae bacterium]